MKIAAVTMVYNEPHFLPIWLQHYAAQVGITNCYVIDHGSDDGSTMRLGDAKVVPLQRWQMDEKGWAEYLSRYCARLLRTHDWVIYTDVDELLVADPRLHPSLAAFCAATITPVITAVGLNVQHMPLEEPPIDPAGLVSTQRKWVKLVSSMCKPALISYPVVWTPGKHSCDAPIVFAPLFLFHLRRYDLAQGLRRLAKTRIASWPKPAESAHQRVSDEDWTARMLAAARQPRREVSLDLAEPPLRELLAEITEEQYQRTGETYRLNINRSVREFWRLPERFVGTF